MLRVTNDGTTAALLSEIEEVRGDVAAAAKQGQRLTKEDAVAQALRNTYGHLRASED